MGVLLQFDMSFILQKLKGITRQLIFMFNSAKKVFFIVVVINKNLKKLRDSTGIEKVVYLPLKKTVQHGLQFP